MRVFVICSALPPDFSAVGNIAYSLMDEMSNKSDVVVDFFTLSDNYKLSSHEKSGGLELHRVLTFEGYRKSIVESYITASCGNTVKKRILSVIGRIINKCMLFQGRNDSEIVKNQQKDLLKLVIKELNKNKPDVLITFSSPFYCHEIGHVIKQKYTEIKWVAYLMDASVNNAVRPIDRDNEHDTLQNTDRIYIIPCLVDDIQKDEAYADKALVVDYPIIPWSNQCVEHSKNDSVVRLAFAGLFYDKIRNPERLLKLMSGLPNNYELHLFSRGCTDIVNKYAKSNERIVLHGFIPKAELENMLFEMDALISIGNTVSNQIPSKIYDYIAMGKPLLNFYQCKEDISLPNVEKYPLSLNLFYNDVLDSINDITAFLSKHRGQTLSYDEATNNLQHCRLDYVSQYILEDIKHLLS